jgi:hypothetical protein
MPFIVSNDASVAPEGPLPMMPTFLMVFLIKSGRLRVHQGTPVSQ